VFSVVKKLIYDSLERTMTIYRSWRLESSYRFVIFFSFRKSDYENLL